MNLTVRTAAKRLAGATAIVIALASTGACGAPQEDDPGWDCRTMGNHVCGVVGQDGVAYAVHYDADGFVDWVQPRADVGRGA